VHNWAKTALKTAEGMNPRDTEAYLKDSLSDLTEFTGTKDLGLYQDLKKVAEKAVQRTKNMPDGVAAYKTALTTVAGMTTPGAAAVLSTIGEYLQQ